MPVGPCQNEDVQDPKTFTDDNKGLEHVVSHVIKTIDKITLKRSMFVLDKWYIMLKDFESISKCFKT